MSTRKAKNAKKRKLNRNKLYPLMMPDLQNPILNAQRLHACNSLLERSNELFANPFTNPINPFLLPTQPLGMPFLPPVPSPMLLPDLSLHFQQQQLMTANIQASLMLRYGLGPSIPPLQGLVRPPIPQPVQQTNNYNFYPPSVLNPNQLPTIPTMPSPHGLPINPRLPLNPNSNEMFDLDAITPSNIAPFEFEKYKGGVNADKNDRTLFDDIEIEPREGFQRITFSQHGNETIKREEVIKKGKYIVNGVMQKDLRRKHDNKNRISASNDKNRREVVTIEIVDESSEDDSNDVIPEKSQDLIYNLTEENLMEFLSQPLDDDDIFNDQEIDEICEVLLDELITRTEMIVEGKMHLENSGLKVNCSNIEKTWLERIHTNNVDDSDRSIVENMLTSLIETIVDENNELSEKDTITNENKTITIKNELATIDKGCIENDKNVITNSKTPNNTNTIDMINEIDFSRVSNESDNSEMCPSKEFKNLIENNLGDLLSKIPSPTKMDNGQLSPGNIVHHDDRFVYTLYRPESDSSSLVLKMIPKSKEDESNPPVTPNSSVLVTPSITTTTPSQTPPSYSKITPSPSWSLYHSLKSISPFNNSSNFTPLPNASNLAHKISFSPSPKSSLNPTPNNCFTLTPSTGIVQSSSPSPPKRPSSCPPIISASPTEHLTPSIPGSVQSAKTTTCSNLPSFTFTFPPSNDSDSKFSSPTETTICSNSPTPTASSSNDSSKFSSPKLVQSTETTVCSKSPTPTVFSSSDNTSNIIDFKSIASSVPSISSPVVTQHDSLSTKIESTGQIEDEKDRRENENLNFKQRLTRSLSREMEERKPSKRRLDDILNFDTPKNSKKQLSIKSKRTESLSTQISPSVKCKKVETVENKAGIIKINENDKMEISDKCNDDGAEISETKDDNDVDDTDEVETEIEGTKNDNTQKVEPKTYTKTENIESKDNDKTKNVESKDNDKTENVESKDNDKTENIELEDNDKTENVEAKDNDKTENVEAKDNDKTENIESEDNGKTENIESEDNGQMENIESKDNNRTENVESKDNDSTENVESKDNIESENVESKDNIESENVESINNYNTENAEIKDSDKTKPVETKNSDTMKIVESENNENSEILGSKNNDKAKLFESKNNIKTKYSKLKNNSGIEMIIKEEERKLVLPSKPSKRPISEVTSKKPCPRRRKLNNSKNNCLDSPSSNKSENENKNIEIKSTKRQCSARVPKGSFKGDFNLKGFDFDPYVVLNDIMNEPSTPK